MAQSHSCVGATMGGGSVDITKCRAADTASTAALCSIQYSILVRFPITQETLFLILSWFLLNKTEL